MQQALQQKPKPVHSFLIIIATISSIILPVITVIITMTFIIITTISISISITIILIITIISSSSSTTTIVTIILVISIVTVIFIRIVACRLSQCLAACACGPDGQPTLSDRGGSELLIITITIEMRVVLVIHS